MSNSNAWYMRRRNQIYLVVLMSCAAVQIAILRRSHTFDLNLAVTPAVNVNPGRILIAIQTGSRTVRADNIGQAAKGYVLSLDPTSGSYETVFDRFCQQARISHDGRFAAFRTGDDIIFIYDVENGDVKRIGDGSDIAGWSPDNTSLIVKLTGENATYGTLHVGDVSPTVMNIAPTIRLLDWSPTGDGLLAMSKEDSDLRLINLDGSTVKTLVSGIRCDCGQFSPDGKAVAYLNYASRGVSLSVLDLKSGMSIEVIKKSIVPGSSMAWSPDSSRLLLNDRKSIRLIKIDGSNSQNVFTAGGTPCLGASDWGRVLKKN